MSSSSAATIQSLAVDIHSRRLLLLHGPLYRQPSEPDPSANGPAASGTRDGRYTSSSGSTASTLDANVVMILAVLLCGLICALGLNSIVRCALRCSSRMAVEPAPNRVTRLARAGLRKKALQSLPSLVYSPGLELLGSDPECAICLSDFVTGEQVRVLPTCSHGFHVRCIDRWLMARSSCPTCRQRLFASSPKSSRCADASQPGSGPVQPNLAPLEPEGMVTDYDF